MPHLCPRPCSRLATAAVFISVGVMQFVVGIILLRSKFVYLLAAPDFWTAACNIAVGCLLCVAASIWKNSAKRRPSKKDIIKRNLLLALLFSALIINVTTLTVFVLGEGNALLSIRLENGKKYEQTTFASEILAYAYVISVCCPIICIVVTIISISGSCFKYSTVKKNSRETKSYVNAIKNKRTQPLPWIYTPELFDKSKKKTRERNLSTSSESPSDSEKRNSSYQNCSSSAEEIHDILSRMAQGKRDSMLTDSAAMLREMDNRRKSKYSSFDRDGSYVAPMLQRARESILGEREPIEQATRYVGLHETRVKELQRDSNLDGNTCLPSNDVIMKRMKFSKSKQLSSLYKNPYTSEELVNEYQNASSKLAKHYPSQYKRFRQFRSTSDLSEREVKEFAGVHKKPRMTEVELELRDIPSEYRDQNKWKSEKVQEENKSFEETSPTYCFSPDGSDFGSDSIFEMSRRSSWAGEIVPINIKHSSGLKLSHKLVPVANPVVPPLPQIQVAPKISDDSGIGSVESNTSEVTRYEIENKRGHSSFQEEQTPPDTDRMPEYPKMGSQSIKKYDMKVIRMASISEEPTTLEKSNRFEESTEGCDLQDDIDLNSWKSYTGKNSSYHLKSIAEKDKVNVRRDTTIKRKTNVSGKALRRMWSLAMSENKNDFRDQVVDEDSLIGLSEKELIERQLRTRSIRKVVQQRMREKVDV